MQTVSTPIDIEGLEGQVEVTSHADADFAGFTHRICYRSKIGEERLTFKFTSTLALDDHSYQVRPRSGDSVSPDGKRWTHRGRTKTGSSREVEGQALIFTDQRDGGSEIEYSVSADHPFSDPYTGKIELVPFT